jgi:hypothetical protein
VDSAGAARALTSVLNWGLTWGLTWERSADVPRLIPPHAATTSSALTTAARGPGGFPPPAGIIGQGVRVWRWADVRPWLVQHDIADPDTLSETLPPALIAATNLQLDAVAGPTERDA